MDRRALDVKLPISRIWTDQPVEVMRLEFVRVASQRFEIGDAVIARAGAEDIAEGQGGERGIAAGAAAADHQELRAREIRREIGAQRGRRPDDGSRAARGIDADDCRRRLRRAGTTDDRAVDGIDEAAILKWRRQPPQGAALADDAERPDAILVD